MGERDTGAAAIGVLALADGRLPTGAHAYSAGTEAAVAVGDVRDLDTLGDFLLGRLATTGRVDAAFAAAACASTTRPDRGASRRAELARELAARNPGPRQRDVAARLARQFRRTAVTLWPAGAFDDQDRASRARDWPPIVLGVATAAAGGTPLDAAQLACHHLATAVGTGAVRLLGLDPVGVAALQVRSLDAVHPELVALAALADAPGAELPADASVAVEVFAEHHGTWPARLFVG